MVNCNDCKWINITEEQQINKLTDHKCLKHKVRVFHRSAETKVYHDYIYPCNQCNGKDFEKR